MISVCDVRMMTSICDVAMMTSVCDVVMMQLVRLFPDIMDRLGNTSAVSRDRESIEF